MDKAKVFEISGDIELDHGYSFAHQITMYFPFYFQKQVIKSQFSLYDVFCDDNDPNEDQKRALMKLTKVDANIFRDISTEQEKVPTNKELTFELRDANLKIMRLKSAHSWLGYCILVPATPDWMKKQNAILGSCGIVDSLLKSAFNYLDVNDLATVNQIKEDSAIEHRKAVERLIDPLNPHNQFKAKAIGTQEGESVIFVDQMHIKGAYNDAYNME